MADITKCKGEECPIKESCYRFKAHSNEYMQSYFTNAPIKKDNTCDHYWTNEKTYVNNTP